MVIIKITFETEDTNEAPTCIKFEYRIALDKELQANYICESV